MLFNPSEIKRIVVHAGCPDGTASAMLLKDALPDAEVETLQYSPEEQNALKAEPGMIFCDISPPAWRAEEFARLGTVVLDHHKTAKDVVAKFGRRGVYADEAEMPGVCGALLAYRYVWEPLLRNVMDDTTNEWVEKFARLAGIRDTWQNKDPLWEEACKQAYILQFMPVERWIKIPMEKLALTWYDSFSWVGDVLTDQRAKAVQRSIKHAVRLTSNKGTRILTINSTQTSDVAESVGNEADLIVGFNYSAEGNDQRMILSTRSHSNFDCAGFAKSLGGGGHLRAAGVNIPCPATSPYKEILRVVNDWEAR